MKVKKIEKGADIKCYKCQKHRANFYLVRTVSYKEIDVPLCNVCLSSFLNYLDDKLIEWGYNQTHDNKGREI